MTNRSGVSGGRKMTVTIATQVVICVAFICYIFAGGSVDSDLMQSFIAAEAILGVGFVGGNVGEHFAINRSKSK